MKMFLLVAAAALMALGSISIAVNVQSMVSSKAGLAYAQERMTRGADGR